MSKRTGCIILGAIFGAIVLTVAWLVFSRFSTEIRWIIFDSGQTEIGIAVSLMIGVLIGGLAGAIFSKSRDRGIAITLIAIGIVLTLTMCPINFWSFALAGSYYGSEAFLLPLTDVYAFAMFFGMALAIIALFLGIKKYRNI